MATWQWRQFCGHNDSLSIWSDADFGRCFEQIVILCPVYVCLMITSVYYTALSQQHVYGARLQVTWKWFLVVRFILCFCLAVVPVCHLMVSHFLLKEAPSIADYVLCGLVASTWLLHGVYVWKLRYLHKVSLRGPKCVIICLLLSVAAEALHMRSVIINNFKKYSQVEEYSTYVSVGLLIWFVLLLIPNSRRSYRANLLSEGINNERLETEPLTWDQIRSYGAISDGHADEEIIVAERGVNCLSWLTFHWMQRLMVKGSKGRIETVSDLYELPDRLDTRATESRFRTILEGSSSKEDSHRAASSDHTSTYETEVNFRGSESNVRGPRTLFQALNAAFGCEYYSLGVLKLLADCFGFAGPILLNYFVNFIEKKAEPEYHGYLYAFGLLLSTFLGTICSTQFDYNSQVVAFKMRCAVITTVYRKVLTVSSVAQSHFSTGQVVNFMSTDTDRIINFCPSFHAFWSLPFQIAVSLYLLYNQVGLAFLAGLGFAVLLIPVNRKLALKIGELSSSMMSQKDARVKLMNEMLRGIRVLKFYAWEDHFMERINHLRELELKSLKGRKYLDALCVYFWATTPVLISILTFTTFVLLGHQLTAAKVFTSLSLFLMLISPLNAFPWVINGLVEAWVSLKRVEEFCSLKEADLQSYYSPMTGLSRRSVTHRILKRLVDLEARLSDADTNVVISIKDGTFSWSAVPSQSEQLAPQGACIQSQDVVSDNASSAGILQLSGINVKVKRGQLVGVIGKVGSGKSSLLNAMLAEMSRTNGHIAVSGLENGFALAAQEAWIQNATLRDNILFHSSYNRSHYVAVLHACALTDDLKALPAGDRTEVGENGVTLSGGQKARVALARAVYQNKEIYLLDDPLAAVDAHVAHHLMQHCIMGLLHHKTCILCTHNVHFLAQADLVLVMEDGRIVKAGPPGEILPTVDFDGTGENLETGKVKRNEERIEGQEEGRLVETEEKEKGVVKLAVYSAYWTAVGRCLSPLILLSLFLMQASRNTSDWWLSYWLSHSRQNSSDDVHTEGSAFRYFLFSTEFIPHHPWFYQLPNQFSLSVPLTNITEPEDNVAFYLKVYGCLAGANSLFTLMRAFLFAYGGICAAQVLHWQLLTSVLKAPMQFFDATPLGRIINRFSSDMYAIDDTLPFQLNIFLANIYGILGCLVVTCYSLPWFTICLLPLAFLYFRIQHYYRHTSRELKRLSNITLSPLYAHFSESIMGLATIRAYRQTDIFQEDNQELLTMNQRAQFCTQAASRWLDLRLRMLGVAIVGAIAFIAVLQHHFQGVDPGMIGLALTYSLSVTNLLGGVVMFFTETEKQLVSVERANHYITNIPSERWTGSLFPPSNWPREGIIKYSSVHMRYRQGLPSALKGVTFETVPGEKLGIVGRTGSGKSSLFLTLFRMVEISEGVISVDGMDLRHLDLKDIRSRFAIIPQDPFLFSGSVRLNLDPTGCCTDGQLLAVLERCHLDMVVQRMGGLESDVGERGQLFSVGQRQLMCLARALLTKAKVLCIDEATASVDHETDAVVQTTIRQEFASSTVLTIAHRINTILDSHRILVMKDGAVAEMAPPSELLQNPDSLFSRLMHSQR